MLLIFLNGLYLFITFLILVVVTIILPRITKEDKNKPMYIYIGFYIINTSILNFIFGFNSFRTLLTNFNITYFRSFNWYSDLEY